MSRHLRRKFLKFSRKHCVVFYNVCGLVADYSRPRLSKFTCLEGNPLRGLLPRAGVTHRSCVKILWIFMRLHRRQTRFASSDGESLRAVKDAELKRSSASDAVEEGVSSSSTLDRRSRDKAEERRSFRSKVPLALLTRTVIRKDDDKERTPFLPYLRITHVWHARVNKTAGFVHRTGILFLSEFLNSFRREETAVSSFLIRSGTSILKGEVFFQKNSTRSFLRENPVLSISCRV